MNTLPSVNIHPDMIGDRIVMTKPEEDPVRPSHPPELPLLRAIRSEEILLGNKEVRIVHEGEVYRLLVTRNGKLILQK
jgi:hemin uptake protein HemP